MQSLCTLRDHCRQGSRNTRYQAGAAPYLDRSSTGWIAPACLAHSFDHLVRAAGKRQRDGDAERLGGLEVNYKLVLGRRLHRQVGRLRSLEYPPDVDTRLPVPIGKAGPVAHQTADLWITTVGIDRGNRMARRQ